MGRITGLDPAAPDFENMPPSNRLDKHDALFVDVIHSDTKSLIFNNGVGMSQPIGHIDFYPNGGFYQPGCSVGNLIQEFFNGNRPKGACSHRRSIVYFIESLKLKNNFQLKQEQMIGFSCEDWEHFQSGFCTDCNKGKCAPLGIDAEKWYQTESDSQIIENDSKSMKMFLKTRDESPFLVHHYLIRIKLTIKDDIIISDRIARGSMWIMFYENFEIIHQQKLSEG